MNRSWLFGLVILGLLQAYLSADNGSVEWNDTNPTQALLSDPIQKTVASKSISHGDYTLQPQASFEITARVLSKTKYTFDRNADLVPVDLALGWGPMSQHKVLDTLKIWQDHRWYFYRYEGSPVIPNDQMAKHSANMHLIPHNSKIESQIKAVKKGEVVHLTGYLVNVTGENGFYWNSSLTREDTGDGSCEVVLVKTIEILP